MPTASGVKFCRAITSVSVAFEGGENYFIVDVAVTAYRLCENLRITFSMADKHYFNLNGDLLRSTTMKLKAIAIILKASLLLSMGKIAAFN